MTNLNPTWKNPKTSRHRRLVITLILVVLAQERGILPVSQILLEPALALAIDIPPPTEQAEQHRQQDKRMRGGPEYEGDPDAEVINLKDLCVKSTFMSNQIDDLKLGEGYGGGKVPLTASTPTRQRPGSS
jgi:hypothetical protein